MYVWNFGRLAVYQASQRLARDLYAATRDLSPDAAYVFRGQVGRAAVSISANLAEGASRRTAPDFGRFVYMSRGSAAELETYFSLLDDLGLWPPRQGREFRRRLDSIQRMLVALIRRLDRHE